MDNPRVVVDPEGRESVLRPHEAGYQNNAAAVGGGTLVYGAQAWRFHPDDFRMASRYGVPRAPPSPTGQSNTMISNLITGAPSGRSEQRAASRGTPERDMRVPDAAPTRICGRRVLAHGAERLGLPTFAPPLLVNLSRETVAGACDECGSCVGFDAQSVPRTARKTLLSHAL